MVLDGNIELSHEGQHESRVEAFQQDHFEGDWQTTSKGTASVFNLMFRNPVEASIQHVQLNKGEKMTFSRKDEHKLLVFPSNGQIQLTDSNKMLEAQELLELNAETVDCQATENCDLIITRINN